MNIIFIFFPGFLNNRLLLERVDPNREAEFLILFALQSRSETDQPSSVTSSWILRAASELDHQMYIGYRKCISEIGWHKQIKLPQSEQKWQIGHTIKNFINIWEIFAWIFENLLHKPDFVPFLYHSGATEQWFCGELRIILLERNIPEYMIRMSWSWWFTTTKHYLSTTPKSLCALLPDATLMISFWSSLKIKNIYNLIWHSLKLLSCWLSSYVQDEVKKWDVNFQSHIKSYSLSMLTIPRMCISIISSIIICQSHLITFLQFYLSSLW